MCIVNECIEECVCGFVCVSVFVCVYVCVCVCAQSACAGEHSAYACIENMFS